MPQAVDSLASFVEQLTERLRGLEDRLSALEKLSAASSGASSSRIESTDRYSSANRPKTRSAETNTWAEFSGVFPTLGKSALGFAGAFLLRAIADSASVPKLPVLSVAVLYAFFWIFWAAQPDWLPGFLRFEEYGTSGRFTRVTYALTSALILCPLLWESTVRFQVLPPATASIILVGFMAVTLALSAGHDLQLISWVAAIATAVTALGLIIATRDLVPLVSAMLAMSLATEITIIFGHPLTFRALPALASDFGIWLLISVLTFQPLPEGYHPAATAGIILLTVLLPTIYAASIAVRGFLQLHRITAFEITQAALSFALATYGTMRVTQNAAGPVLGAIFLLLAMVCYWGTLWRFAAETHTRNRRISANAAAALLLAGSFLLLPTEWELPFLCVAALFTTMMYTRTLKLSLGLHASVYIAAATAISPLPAYVASTLGGSISGNSQWPAFTIALVAAFCYAVGSRTQFDQTRRRLLWIVSSAVAASSLAALVVRAAVQIIASHTGLGASDLSVIRTIVICVLALSLGLSARPPRIELGWIAYAAVAFGTLKLMFEDLRFGNPASLVLSFLFYGLVLILLPRVIRRARPG